jgi:uridine kinase
MHKFKTHIRYKNKRKKVQVENLISKLLLQLFPGKCAVIAVGGPGGTGKSTFTSKLAELLPDSTILYLDDYKTPRAERYGQNLFGAHPKANKMNEVQEHVSCLKEGKSFNKPVYNAENGTTDTTIHFTPGRFNLLDGEISTYREFRDIVDFAIFIDSDWQTQLNTRITRDIEERKYSEEKAIATFLQSNLREFRKYGAESKNWADIHLYCRADYHLELESVEEGLYKHFQEILETDFASIQLSGTIADMPTPFIADFSIDRDSFIRHLEFLAANSTERILVGGVTGEYFSLTLDERKDLLLLARRFFPGAVFFDISAASWKVSLELAEFAYECGCDALHLDSTAFGKIFSEENIRGLFAGIDLPLFIKGAQNIPAIELSRGASLSNCEIAENSLAEIQGIQKLKTALSKQFPFYPAFTRPPFSFL